MRFLDRCPALVLGLAALTGCAATSADAGGSGEEANDGEKSLASLQRAFEAAQADAAQAELDAADERAELEAAVLAAAEELDEAKREIADWSATTAPLALEKAKLELQASEMALAEQQEELTQLELMYAEQDLADKTRELVLARTKRRIEQSTLALDLDRRELDALGRVTHPAQQREFEAAIAAKTRALAAAQRKARVGWSGKQVELLKAKNAVADAMEALDEAKKEAEAEEKE